MLRNHRMPESWHRTLPSSKSEMTKSPTSTVLRSVEAEGPQAPIYHMSAEDEREFRKILALNSFRSTMSDESEGPTMGRAFAMMPQASGLCDATVQGRSSNYLAMLAEFIQRPDGKELGISTQFVCDGLTRSCWSPQTPRWKPVQHS